MSETELSVICKNCGSEVSPYVTECPYCGARLRKRAPKLERRGDGLEPRPRRGPASRLFRIKLPSLGGDRPARPYATPAAIVGPALLLLVEKALGASLLDVGALLVPFADAWWRFLVAPFAYADVGYLFVVALGLAIFGPGVERRLGSVATAILLLACGALGMLAASGVANAMDDVVVIAGGNGIALGAVAAWFAIRRSEARHSIDRDYDPIAVAVAAVVLLALPIFESTADPVAGVAGAMVGGLAGLAAARLRREPTH
ncbi:MAG TPA: rhomboid family intramembrane serine protease [Solirubrobacterales bacterium]|nr:rhomboid family intramembrane serine protease [Solirubrobacterales bacterium]